MKNHLFARLCRVAGRFLLCIGAISMAGSILLALAPLLFEDNTNPADIPSQPTIAIDNPKPSETNFLEVLPYIILSVVFTILIFIAIAFVMRRYNDGIRKLISQLARLFHLSIQITELFLTVFVWSIVVLLTAFHAPLFSILALCFLIINELCFIFAWAAYGGKNYTA